MATSRPRPLKIGYFVGSITGGMRDGALRWNDLRAMAQQAEAVGFDSFWIPDHLLFRFPGEASHGPWEGWSLLSALAATTTRLEVGSLVACVAYRNPALLAKMADTVEEISGGRLTLGLGAGWHEPEYRAFGYPYDHRFERFDEAVRLIRDLLREGRTDYVGRFYEARNCELRPRGPRLSGPPILIGTLASRPRMLRLAATHAEVWNGWLVHARSNADQVPALQAAVDSACAAVGRDPATLERTIGIAVDQRAEAVEAARGYTGLSTVDLTAAERQPLSGEPAAIAAELRRFAAAGISHLQIAPVIDGLAGIEAFAPVIAELDRG
jgi:alkanesulfonate monooxygenase SsuD/methylene tetrahydromethanopterin reductase-like flavin-dependent oxidoreductase (luciferase family)